MLHSSYYTCKARYFSLLETCLLSFLDGLCLQKRLDPPLVGIDMFIKNTSNKTLLLLILLFLENTVIMTMRLSLVVHYILLMGWIHPQLIPYWSCSSSTRSEASWCLNLHFHAHFFEVILFQIMSFRNCAFFNVDLSELFEFFWKMLLYFFFFDCYTYSCLKWKA